MTKIISRENAEAIIQEQLINVIQQDAPKQSVFMAQARKLPNMTSKQTRMPVLDMLPMAYWVNGDTGMKQTSQQAWDNVFLTAEELAVIVPIPEAVLDDASFDILGEGTDKDIFGGKTSLTACIDALEQLINIATEQNKALNKRKEQYDAVIEKYPQYRDEIDKLLAA